MSKSSENMIDERHGKPSAKEKTGQEERVTRGSRVIRHMYSGLCLYLYRYSMVRITVCIGRERREHSHQRSTHAVTRASSSGMMFTRSTPQPFRKLVPQYLHYVIFNLVQIIKIHGQYFLPQHKRIRISWFKTQRLHFLN